MHVERIKFKDVVDCCAVDLKSDDDCSPRDFLAIPYEELAVVVQKICASLY